MKRCHRFPLSAAVPCLLLAGAAFARAQVASQELGVYEYVVQSATGSVDSVAAAVESAAPDQGFRVLARVPAGSPEGCPYKAQVLVLVRPDYAQQVMAANRKTGPFAVVDRVNVFEDEKGVHVSIVNPRSINRTILMDDSKFRDLSEKHRDSLRQLITGSVQGTASDRQYGEMRSRGYIGRTMGVMAGGPFDGRLEDVAVVGGLDWRPYAAKVAEGLKKPGAQWGMHLVYELELPEYETVVFGSTGTPMDAKSFSIVAAGGDDSRSSLKCPGLDHAGAYPIEVVLTHEGQTVRTRLVNVMYRMKMYFEDAGKWAFMKNMGMPGSIQDELRDQIRPALGIK